MLMYCTIVTDEILTIGHYRCYQSCLKEYKSSSGDEKLWVACHIRQDLIRPFYIKNSVGWDFIWSHKTGSHYKYRGSLRQSRLYLISDTISLLC